MDGWTTPAAAAKTWAEYYGDRLTLPELYRHLANMQSFITVCETFAPGRRLLEIGTGTGLQAVYLGQKGYEVTGIDRDPAIIQANVELGLRFEGAARFIVADMFRPPFSSGAFDLCYHQGLLEHFDPPQIREALTLQLSLSRRVVFTVPTTLWTGGLFGDERLWTGAAWHRLLEGFEILHVFGLSHCGGTSRAIAFAGRRFTQDRPRPLYRWLALHRAGQIGFVIEAR